MNLFVFVAIILIPLAYSTERLNIGGDGWTVSGTPPDGEQQNIEIKAVVPGGIYTDLMREGIIDDIFYGYGDEIYRWVGRTDWTYSSIFSVPEYFFNYETINLVFEGLDTFATIFINGQEVGNSENMFVKYSFNINTFLHESEDINTIEVRFRSAVTVGAELAKQQNASYNVPPECPVQEYRGECNANQVRKMQASFAWDWGPSFPSTGIWKDVYIEAFNTFAIQAVLVTIEDPRSLMITTYLRPSEFIDDDVNGTLTATLFTEFGSVYDYDLVNLTVNEFGEVACDIFLDVDEDLKLWWPNGYGEQNLYNLTVVYTSGDESEQDVKNLRIGIRQIELVENQTGDGLSFYFKVNGIPIFAKGANSIPLSILPELGQDPNLVDKVLQSAKDVNMNMIRVWGGGVYESDYYYSKADELGILIWQDFMFACAMYPTREHYLKSVTDEVRYQFKRIQHHPSVIIWSGNNENEGALRDNWYGTTDNFSLYYGDYVKLYIETVKVQVDKISPEALFVASSPSNGLQTEDEGWVASKPSDSNYGDIHFYDYSSDSWNTSTFPIARFASEYGYQSMPSIDSWLTATNDSANVSPDSEFLQHRQHHPNGNTENINLIKQQLNLPEPSHERYKEAFIYFSQILQAQSIKIETEHYRSYAGRLTSDNRGNTMGALYWQLNDVWVAPTWSSIDFTGRWKMLHYFAKDFFAPTIVSAEKIDDNTVSVYASTDLLDGLKNVVVVMHVFKWDKLEPASMESSPITLNYLNVVTIPYDLKPLLNGAGCGEGDQAMKNCFLHMHIMDSDMQIHYSPANYLFLEHLKDSNLQNATVQISDIKLSGDAKNIFDITVTTDAIALFVWLDSHEISGRFSTNGFLQISAEQVVQFTSEKATTVDELRNVLTVTHLRDSSYYQ